MALNLAPFGGWTLRDKAAQRRLARRHASHNTLSAMPIASKTRRNAIALAAALLFASDRVLSRQATSHGHPDAKWFQHAQEMKLLAESWGDQSYGAVLVLDEQLIGLGPSRVVKDTDVDAHAERVAIRDAQRRRGQTLLSGSVLYSTSRPCALCEAAAAQAGVSRMYYGAALKDAGQPRTGR
jgi:tRNA(Arg) A34 adenosine deaminase TadA